MQCHCAKCNELFEYHNSNSPTVDYDDYNFCSGKCARLYNAMIEEILLRNIANNMPCGWGDNRE